MYSHAHGVTGDRTFNVDSNQQSTLNADEINNINYTFLHIVQLRYMFKAIHTKWKMPERCGIKK